MKEFRLRLKNRPGALAKVAEAMAKEQINIEAIAGMVTYYSGSIRMVTDDPDRARSVLECLGLRFDEKEALVVDVANIPGELSSILRGLEDQVINVESAYPTLAGKQLILTVDQTEKAKPLLPLSGRGSAAS